MDQTERARWVTEIKKTLEAVQRARDKVDGYIALCNEVGSADEAEVLSAVERDLSHEINTLRRWLRDALRNELPCWAVGGLSVHLINAQRLASAAVQVGPILA